MTDRIGLNGNDIIRETRGGVGKLGFTLTNLTSGEQYELCAIPAGSVVTNVFTVVTVAFNGTTPTVDVGKVGAAAYYADDLAVTGTGLTKSATSAHYLTTGEILTVTPTFTNTTVGELSVFVEYMTQTSTGAYSTAQ